jgi:pimeloyl-ACP methyl ester carboxylesterase
VNDDTDRGDEAVGNSDTPGARAGLLEFDGRDPNHGDLQVNGACDLIDWFPVYLNITNLMGMFPPELNEYRLAHADDALNFSYSDLSPAEAGRYQTNTVVSGFGPNLNQPVSSATCQRVTANGVALSPAFLDRVRSGGKGVLLFEARKPTDQPLRLEIWNQRRLAMVVELPLQISGVEDMYGWLNVRQAAGQEPTRISNLDPSNEPSTVKDDRSIVFVHGYNVNEHQSRGWAAEMFKRLWWAGSNARFVAVSWHGDQSQLLDVSVNYQANVINAFATASPLASFVNGLARRGDVTLIGHSLGNMVASAAIQDYGARPSRFFMADAAVAIEAYVPDAETESEMIHPKWKSYEERLFASEWHRLFPLADGRGGLTWRGRFSDVLKRTAVFNFYSSGEEVLKNMDVRVNTVLGGIVKSAHDLVFGVTGSYAWGMQETLKGTGVTGYFLSSSHGGWGFSWEYGLVSETDGTVPQVHVPLAPSEATAADLPDGMLRSKPFFSAGPFTFHVTDGSAYANADQTRLLAEMFPARTFAVGRNPISRSQRVNPQDGIGINLDMNNTFKSDWPESRVSSRKAESWLHSDIKDVAFPFCHGLFREWTKFGTMK